MFQECKNKRAQKFKEWSQALLNHLWYSVSSAKGDGALCQEYAVSALLHAIDIHEWPTGPMSAVLHDAQAAVLGVDEEEILKNDPVDLPGKLIKELEFQKYLCCGHSNPVVQRVEKSGLDPNSKSYQVFQKTFTSDSFLNDVKNLSPDFATSALEGFQGLVTNKYRSKNSYFDPKSFEEKTMLAVLHYNNNRIDELEGRRKVRKVITRSAKHRGGEMVKKNLKTPTDYTWKLQLYQRYRSRFENI
uniref:Uncharacterized protein n=1 Tax=Panagrolaimus superbus TaxID=310955 RepID=A0A914YR09_9BILA